ncbi:MAG: YbhB/YbcL family Raf kinase inhibitor-like protein [Alphaproteobacteria bacterium]|nr:YbhB/YbcL family Raf kinase inhibitor-like protein [Alphaproteobacteria bacterium]
MYLVSDSFVHLGWIPARHAFGQHDPTHHFALAGNRSPHLAWGDVPAGTKSFALICHDPDVPSRGDDVNQEGRTVPRDLPRVDFFHWVLLDLPADLRELAEGAFADGPVAHGKAADAGPIGTSGINDYTGWFAGDPAMKGNYYGYDGPAPPWNDSIVHGYHFTIHALDVATTGMHGSFDGHKARQAIARHVLGTATLVGLYAINPAARQAQAAHLAG